MRFLLLAVDYDGTLATDGQVDDQTLEALEHFRASGRKLVLVTGRHLPDLREVFPRLELFECVVAENGGLLYRPCTREEKPLSEAPDPHFIAELRRRSVPASVGRSVVATWKPHDLEVLSAIRDLGLDLQVIFNKGAVMVLPSGVNKASGLKAALKELGISRHNVVAVGDAENDHSFLRIAECAVAVANALPALKERADIVTEAPRGAGVRELIEHLLRDDLAEFESRLQQHMLVVGRRVSDLSPVLFSPRGGSMLVAGPSASGKSTAVTGILEQLIQRRYQFCLLDPEGDYEDILDAVAFGTPKEPPDPKAILRALESPGQSVVVNLLGVPLGDRPKFFMSLLSPLHELRLRSGHPHLLVVDEAHHLLPSSSSPSADAGDALENTILITVHPDHIARLALERVSVVVAIGERPMQTFQAFAKVVQAPPPQREEVKLAVGEALVWFCGKEEAPILVKTVQSSKERRRHLRQYAEGELSPEESFYFRGPQLALNLRAQNLKVFLQIAEGIDDATWAHHLRQGDFSRWFKTMIKDEELARCAAEVERDTSFSPEESRRKIKDAVVSRYTAPA